MKREVFKCQDSTKVWSTNRLRYSPNKFLRRPLRSSTAAVVGFSSGLSIWPRFFMDFAILGAAWKVLDAWLLVGLFIVVMNRLSNSFLKQKSRNGSFYHTQNSQITTDHWSLFGILTSFPVHLQAFCLALIDERRGPENS